MKPGDRLFCLLIEPESAAYTFTSWPLHVTILPWFRLDLPSFEIVDDLYDELGHIHSFSITMGEEHLRFGHQQGKFATLVQLPSPVTEIEQRIRQYLHSKQAWMVDESTKTHWQYKPHVTEQGPLRLAKVDTFQVTAVYLINQQGSDKIVDATIPLMSKSRI